MTESERKAASEKYYQELREKLDERIRKDKRLNNLLRKIMENAADFNDTAQYSELVSNHIAAVLQENIGEIASPLAKEFVCTELLKEQHSAINETLGKVQVSIDEKNGIHINPQKATFPIERVKQVAHALEDTTVSPETIKRRAYAPVANVSKSFHDDYMKKNAKFRNDAGLKCYIVRMGTNCCTWCSEVAGKYKFGEQPDDIFRRHDNCDCTIIYDNQVLRGKQTVDGGRTKTWEQIGNVPTDYQPTVFTPEQAKAIEQRNLQYKGLTSGENNGIIGKTREFEPLSPEKVVSVLRNDSQEWVDRLSSEEVRAVKKYTKNSGDPKDDKFYARLNAMLRGNIPENDTLNYYSDVISGAISKFELQHDIVCYRTLDFDAYKAFSVGDIFIDPQFISTSVVKSRTLNNPFMVKINIPKGSSGAYIEMLSKYPNQREFVIDKQSVCRIVSKSDNFVELEILL